MKNFEQQIINFDFEKNFKDEDFYVSKSNEHVFNFLNLWPNWDKNFLNISGENFSGKTHLTNIFIKKFKGIRLKINKLKELDFKEIKIHQNIILEDLNKKSVDEKLIYSLINYVEQENKYLIITSNKPIVQIKFDLDDLRSRAKLFIIQNIDKPDDDLIFALILKNLSDRQIIIEKKLIDYIIKRIDRSYGKIFDFIYKIDEKSLKNKKSINLNLIKEALGE